MEVTISDKYQIVVPRQARRKFKIRPGQKARVTRVTENTITFTREPTMEELIQKSRGTLKDAPWQKEGMDAAKWLRRERDSDWK